MDTGDWTWLDVEVIVRCYDPWISEVEHLELENKFGLLTRPLRYLVFAEQSDQLYLVTRHLMEQMNLDGSLVEEDIRWCDYPYKTISFSVHKVDRDGEEPILMEGSLDGLAMFLGLNHSFAMSKFSGLKPNSIYFTDDRVPTPPWCDGNYGGHDIGIFDYENRTISPCYYHCDVQSFKRIMPAPIWFTPIQL